MPLASDTAADRRHLSITRVSDPATGTGAKSRYQVCAYGQSGCPQATPTSETLARTLCQGGSRTCQDRLRSAVPRLYSALARSSSAGSQGVADGLRKFAALSSLYPSVYYAKRFIE